MGQSLKVVLYRFVIVALAVCAIALPTAATADDGRRVAKLAHTLTTHKSSKARLSAAVTLGEMRDVRALRPLIRALRDRNDAVRAVAATSLGLLGKRKALPALKRASRDRDGTVRKSAVKAIATIRRGGAARQVARRKKRRRRRPSSRMASYRISARERPRLRATPPEVYVVVKSASDESKARVRKRLRKRREHHIKDLMRVSLQRLPQVTTYAEIAKKHRLSPYYIDLEIIDFERRVAGRYVEVECSVRIGVSNQRGKMLSVMTGGAKVQVPRGTFRRQYEGQMRLEALENAVEGIHRDVVSYLRQNPS